MPSIIFFWIISHGWAMWGVTGIIAACSIAVAYLFPSIRLAAIGVAVGIVLLSSYNAKIRSDAQHQIISKIEKENTNAINKAQTARKVQRDLCIRAPFGCVSGDWFRD